MHKFKTFMIILGGGSIVAGMIVAYVGYRRLHSPLDVVNPPQSQTAIASLPQGSILQPIDQGSVAINSTDVGGNAGSSDSGSDRRAALSSS